jgi:hypothetical protein
VVHASAAGKNSGYDRIERTTLPLLTLAWAVINTRRLIKTGF